MLPDHLDEGRHEPFGALARDGGVNFAVFSDHATRIEVCLFDAAGEPELGRLPLHGPHDGVFHGFLPGAGPGLVYGLRAHGPYQPARGHRFNPNKLLLDPYAREIVGQHTWRPEHSGYETGHPDGARSYSPADNARWALKARVAEPRSAPAPGWHNAPRRPVAEMVLYELHVKGFTQQLAGVPEALRGTYAGLAHPAAIEHLQRLGATTLSLLPVQYALDEPALAARGQVNHWGYNTLGFFCPHARYSATPDDPAATADEFRRMVHTLHAHGLEVVLDVVYNHTPEGDEHGTTLSFRGLDHASWYRLHGADRSRCENLTGCGNTVNVAHPRVAQFVLDSLRYWAKDMGVDGFRFDLAPVLGRTAHGFDPQAAFFASLRQDPVLARVHLIAEPWDAAYDGYQVGRFPGRFLEWNDKFRDGVRRYWLAPWRSDGASRGELARRFMASSDLFHHGQRRPSASINYLAVHDGFTLADLTSYAHKHNEANGENNRDGRDGEPSATLGGPEGPSDDAAVLALRGRVRRALLATVLFAQGTPMLAAGDELGRTQGGNNNAYNQDNPTGWIDWAAADHDLAAFAARCIALRQAEPSLRHDRWYVDEPCEDCDCGIVWLAPQGRPLADGDWHDARQRAFACQITRGPGLDPRLAAPTRLLIAFNPQPQAVPFVLPARAWTLRLDSSGELPEGAVDATLPLAVPAHALVLLSESELESSSS